jgi:hypothetical protein
MKSWDVKITMSVADTWIADGFDLSERIEDIKEQFKDMLPSAYDNEVKVNVVITKKPEPSKIEALRNGTVTPRD